MNYITQCLSFEFVIGADDEDSTFIFFLTYCMPLVPVHLLHKRSLPPIVIK